MLQKDLRIIFMGTPEFAVESLKALVKHQYNVVAVITMPDKAIGKHQSTLQGSPVKAFALENNIPLLQPANLKDPIFIEELRSFEADLQIVVAFRMLPEVVWNMPRLGTFNLHASLLPQYRGAAPINWPIVNGDKETGITTFFLQHEIDTGNIIQRVSVPITEEDTAGTLHDKLMTLGASLVVETVENIIQNKVNPIPQESLTQELVLKKAPKIFKETCCIPWKASVEEVYNFVRGFSPYPAAWTNVLINQKNTTLKIFKTSKIIEQHSTPIGALHTDNKTFLRVALKDGFINLLELQLAGKKKMNVKDFLNGNKIDEHWKLIL